MQNTLRRSSLPCSTEQGLQTIPPPSRAVKSSGCHRPHPRDGPQVILFDEPASALDPEMVKEVPNVIKYLAGTGITMALVAHEMGFTREVANRICFLDEGRLVEDAPPKIFFSTPKSDHTRAFLDKAL